MTHSSSHVLPGKKTSFTTTKVLVAFQTRPGVGADKLIQDAGSASVTLKDRGGNLTQVTLAATQGIYSLDLPAGGEAMLEILGCEFHVASLAAKSPDPGFGLIQWKAPLLPKATLKGMQQRLQLLGYYTGRVDGNMGAKTERALLEFQADEGSLKINGEPDAPTQNALDGWVESKNKDASGKYYIVRRYLIRFQRANHGPSVWDFPQLDFRGGDDPVVAFGFEAGHVPDLMRYLKSFYLRLAAEWVGESLAPFFITLKSKSETVLAVQIPKLQARPDMMKFQVKGVGKETIEIRCGSEKGPVVARAEARIEKLQYVNIHAHILKVMQMGTNLSLAAPSNWTEEEIRGFISGINAIWIASGIEFNISGFEENIVSTQTLSKLEVKR
jgi:hypothetical protein